MSTESTLGWSLLSSGLVTLFIGVLPGPDLLWGVALCVLGVAVLVLRGGRRY
jgi:hypothetical protein